MEKTVADLSLCYQRSNVVYLELCSGQLVVHLLHYFLKLLCELLALLQAKDILLVLVE